MPCGISEFPRILWNNAVGEYCNKSVSNESRPTARKLFSIIISAYSKATDYPDAACIVQCSPRQLQGHRLISKKACDGTVHYENIFTLRSRMEERIQSWKHRLRSFQAITFKIRKLGL